jgi:hypothetical protein
MPGNAQNRVAVAQQHVIEAEGHVARQRDVLTELERDAHAKAAELARAILQNLERSLELAREHLKREQDGHANSSSAQ